MRYCKRGEKTSGLLARVVIMLSNWSVNVSAGVGSDSGFASSESDCDAGEPSFCCAPEAIEDGHNLRDS